MAFFGTKSGNIVASLVVAVALVGGAYYFSSGRGTPQANAESSQDALKAYATLDSDGDGLPDWEEALYGTDPHNPDTFHLGMTDGEAVAKGLIKLKVSGAAPIATSTPSLAAIVPGPDAATSSMTDQFAQAFFDNYISTRGSEPPTADEEQQFVEGAVANLVQTDIRPDAYTESDISVSGSGAAALGAFAARVDQAFATHGANVQYDELTYFADATEKGDANAVASLTAIANAYTGVAQAVAAIPVPSEAAAADLSFVNTAARLGGTISDLAAVQTDPIRALVALGNYTDDSQAFVLSLQSFAPVFAEDGVNFSEGQDGYDFYHLVQFAVQASSTQP